VAGNKSHNILMLTTDGEIIGSVIVDDVSNPNKITLAPGADRMFVSQYSVTLIDGERNLVKVFTLPW